MINVSLLSDMLAHLDSGVVVMDEDQRVVFWNRWLERFTGYTAEDVRNKTLPEIWTEGLDPSVLEIVDEAVNSGLSGTLSQSLHPQLLPLESVEYGGPKLRQKLTAIPITAGVHRYCQLNVHDVTDSWHRDLMLREQSKELRTQHEELRSAEERLRSIFDLSPDSILLVNGDGSIEQANSMADNLFEAHIHGSDLRSLFKELVDQEDWLGYLYNASGSDEVRNLELTGVRPAGEFPVELSAVSVNSHASDNFCVFCRDISERKSIEQKLTLLAEHDHLTGLANRLLFSEALKHALKRKDRHDEQVALLYIDLDNFKPVNDNHGHDIGDAYLKVISERLVDVVRDEDILARIGGDEFAIIVENEQILPEDMAAFAKRILKGLNQDVELAGAKLTPSASIGIAINSSHEPEEMIQHADTAMYQAKNRGKNRYQIYSRESASEWGDTASMQFQLDEAIRQQQLSLLYQPILMVGDGSLAALEVFLRWDHPKKGMLSPPAFLPMLINNNYQLLLDEWVLNRALYQWQSWVESGDISDNVCLSLNMPVLSLAGNSLLNMLEGCISQSGVDPQRIIIELTEQQLLKTEDGGKRALHQLERLGIKLAIDDFGSGASSLAVLSQLPVSVLKVDRTLVTEMILSDKGKAVVASIIQIAHNLGMSVVAEGVENRQMLIELEELDCDGFQGYFCSKPLPGDKLSEFMTLVGSYSDMH